MKYSIPNMKYCRVAVDAGTTDSLTYEIPDGLAGRIGIGTCVLVPLGPRQAVGYVVGFEDRHDLANIRAIISDIDSPVHLTDDMLRLAHWISERYLCPLPRTVSSMLPGVMHCRLQQLVTSEPISGKLSSLTPSELSLLDSILECGGSPPVSVNVETLMKTGDKTALQRFLRQLESKGFVRRYWRLAPPEGKPRMMRGVRFVAGVDGDGKLTAKQSAAMEVIAGIGRDAPVVELGQRHDISRSCLESLEKKGLIEWVDIAMRRVPAYHKMPGSRVALTGEQQAAVDAITHAVDSGKHERFLLHGVTASGKTEVYLRCIEKALSQGKTSLVLLPEIAITTQVMNIFKSRFEDHVAVLHSALSAGERCDEWTRVESGEARIVLGARSAVFAPLANLGLVVVDEEHDGSYKQDNPPRYHGCEVAIRRAEESGAALVLGSATPSVETYYRAEQGELRLLEMPNRVENRPMPVIHVADFREEGSKGRTSIFSELMENAIREHLSRGRQVMLLQNRRAYSTFLLCRDCGFVPSCPNCAVTLKFHSAERKMSCHHCDYTEPAPSVCPKCQGMRVKRFGIGTERVEEETKAAFPDARVLRMDRDTTARKGSHASILGQFRRGEADILVGTQMIAKGLDFPNVTLVGVISADTSLNFPDYNASERTFQLISQVSGRSGRGTEPGEVVIQTFDPEHYAIQCAVNHDYLGFYRQELEGRRELGYPPFASMVNITSRDEDNRAAESRLKKLSREIESGGSSPDLTVLGPAPAVLAKLRGEYRWHLVLRSADRDAMLALLRGVFERNPEVRRNVAVDVDPVSML